MLFYVCTMVRRRYEQRGAVPLRLCSSPDCHRFNNAPRWHTCCGLCGREGHVYHTPECAGRQFKTGMFLLRSQALLENVLAQMEKVPPSRKEVPTSSVGDSTEDASVLTGDVSVQSEAEFAFV